MTGWVIYFKLYVIAPGMVESSEGGVAILSVMRADASKSAALSYRTVNGSAMSNDYEQVCNLSNLVCCPCMDGPTSNNSYTHFTDYELQQVTSYNILSEPGHHSIFVCIMIKLC